MIAATFHFPSGELWEMEVDDLEFWVGEATWINKR